MSAASASLRVRVRVRNGSAAAAAVTVKSTVVRADGTVETELSTTGTVASATTQALSATATIASPHLWNGLADPDLYRVYAQVLVGGHAVDWVSAPLGFRFFSVDPALGFFLNGSYLDLHGVDRHQDRLNMGWAITDKEQDEDMGLIREVGANLIRLSHYQHAQHFIDLADRPDRPLGRDSARQRGDQLDRIHEQRGHQMTELISSKLQSPGDRLLGARQRTAQRRRRDQWRAQQAGHAGPDRGSVASLHLRPLLPVGHLGSRRARRSDRLQRVLRLVHGQDRGFGPWADTLHAGNPKLKIGVSEYGAGASVTQHQDRPRSPRPPAPSIPRSGKARCTSRSGPDEEPPLPVGEDDRVMFDFASDGRSEGDTLGRNDKGLVTYDRKTRKDAFYWYKANWTTAPFVYITSRRFTPRTTASVSVKVYSNTSPVTLTVNGTTVGTLTSTNHVFTWTNVALAPGSNTVAAAAGSGAAAVNDVVTWTRSKPRRRRLGESSGPSRATRSRRLRRSECPAEGANRKQVVADRQHPELYPEMSKRETQQRDDDRAIELVSRVHLHHQLGAPAQRDHEARADEGRAGATRGATLAAVAAQDPASTASDAIDRQPASRQRLATPPPPQRKRVVFRFPANAAREQGEAETALGDQGELDLRLVGDRPPKTPKAPLT